MPKPDQQDDSNSLTNYEQSLAAALDPTEEEESDVQEKEQAQSAQ